MAYNHGARYLERPTSIAAPIQGTAGLQVVFGTAPVNLAKDPYGVTNKPVLCYTFEEASMQLGYSSERNDKDFFLYTLCESMYASFQTFGVAPVVFVNVLDPNTHKKDFTDDTVAVVKKEATLEKTGVLLDKVNVKNASSEDQELTKDKDYVLEFTDEGFVKITLLATDKTASAESLKVSGSYIDPSMVQAKDVIGVSGKAEGEKGFEVLRQVYPRFKMTPGLILAPGWAQKPEVAVALSAKCVEINGYFSCEGFVDVPSDDSAGATYYTDVSTKKEASGVSSGHMMAVWPCAVSGSVKFWGSSVMAALTAYTDAANDDVPNLSPSNKAMGITGTVLADAKCTVDENGNATWDKEVILDKLQANVVNGFGVSTFINENGWRSWGNRTAAYPGSSDPKDAWFCVRRFFSWWGNTFVLTYNQEVDNPMDRRLIEKIVASENIRGAALVSAGKCAAISVSYNEADNPITDIINGKITFATMLAPFTPAEDILNTLEFDPNGLKAALGGE